MMASFNSFSVDCGQAGRWFCFSGCGRGGDVFEMEMALTGASFIEAKRTVFDIVGRPDPLLTGAERRERARQHELDKTDQEHARLWRRKMLRTLDEVLMVEKARAFDPIQESLDDGGESICTLTKRESHMQGLRGPELLATYRDYRAHDPVGARRMVSEAADDERDAEWWAKLTVRILEYAERLSSRRAA